MLEKYKKWGIEPPDRSETCFEDPNYKDFLEKDHAQLAFLLSPSFELDGKPPEDGVEPNKFNFWQFDLKYAPLMDKRISEITQEYPGRFVGFCSIEYSWPRDFLLETLETCLSLPGMKGIKIHTAEVSSINPQVVQTLREAFSLASGKRPVILWHLDTADQSELREASKENRKLIKKYNYKVLKSALKFVNDFPQMTFIFAHVFHSLDAFKQLRQIERARTRKRLGGKVTIKRKFKNLYVETSTVERTLNKEEIVELRGELRRFGIDRVLFGSDNAYFDGSIHNLDKVMGFTKKEQEQILYKNGYELLKRLKK